MEKKKIEERKTALQNQHDDVAQKITQGKNALGNLEATLMGLTRAIVWGIFIVFYFFIFFLLLSGCAYFKKNKIDEDEIIITDLPPLEMSQDKKIACIKLKPECND